MKIEIQTNIKDHDLTVESCSEIIQMLQLSYKSIRQQMYSQFLAMKHLKNALILAIISLVCYILSNDIIFLYAMPAIILLFMFSSIIMAEYLTSKTKKIISNQIKHFINQRELLIKKENQTL